MIVIGYGTLPLPCGKLENCPSLRFVTVFSLFLMMSQVHDQMHPQPLSDNAGVLVDASQCVQLYKSVGAAKAPHPSVDVAHHARTLLEQHNIVGGVFDKKLTKQYGVCKSLHEMRVASAMIFGTRTVSTGLLTHGASHT